MTDQDQDIAVAKALGWTIYGSPDQMIGRPQGYSFNDGPCKNIHSYGTDLNALASARNQLINTTELRVKWVNTLRSVCGRRCPKNKAGHRIVSDVDLLFAEATELREVLLKTLNLWKP